MPLFPQIVHHYVIFYLLDISVKFCDDSFIGKNALHWLMLEVLPKKQFSVYKWGAVGP